MNISAIQREEDKVKRSLKEAAKKGDKGVCTILAKEVIRARKAINKIHTSKAHLNSIMLQMKNQSATLRVAGALQKSTEVMQAMQNLVRVPEVAAAMRELSKEMMRVTLSILSQLTWKILYQIKMLEETMDTMEDPEEMEEEAGEEVDKVLWELTAGQLGKAPEAVTDTLPPQAETASASPLEDDNELEDMQSRLQALRS
uniref:Charged multivesicular body protein 3 n=1 Tax=Timema monikensis TaxID=170555 RepID=A0A7R9E2R7_9NEOP|nr:unnamed protein product [Timema monikensis]